MTASFQPGSILSGLTFSFGATMGGGLPPPPGTGGGPGCGMLATAEKMPMMNMATMQKKIKNTAKNTSTMISQIRPIPATAAAQTPKMVARIVPVLSSWGGGSS